MNNRLMISVAVAALIAGTGLANAQGTMGREAPAAGAAAQQSAPSAEHAAPERGAPTGEMKHDAAKPEMKSTQSEEKSPAAAKTERADEGMQGQKSKTMSADEKPGMKPNSMSSENEKSGGKDLKAEGREDRNGNMKADSKNGSENKTVGQAGAGGKMTTEQRTKVTSVIREQHVQPVTNVNFSISVGTRVPREVSFHPLPTEIVTVYPDWRGYQFILVGNQIVVVNPQSFEIVAVLDA